MTSSLIYHLCQSPGLIPDDLLMVEEEDGSDGNLQLEFVECGFQYGLGFHVSCFWVEKLPSLSRLGFGVSEKKLVNIY
jgi:hypothetical protein